MSERDRNMIETLREGNRNLRADLAAAQAELRELRLLRDRVNAALTSDAWGNDLAAAVEGLASRYRALETDLASAKRIKQLEDQLAAAQARIAALEAERQWVSVEEGKPDAGRLVLFRAYNSVYIGAYYPEADRWIGDAASIAAATHWRPLPQPPGGEG